MEFKLLEIKTPQQQQMEVVKNETRESERGKEIVYKKRRKHRSKTEVAGSQSGSCTVNKISPQGA